MTSAEAQTAPLQEPTNAPGRAEIPVEGRVGADAVSGSNEFISWGARSDVGLVRGHNEDSFLLRTPLFMLPPREQCRRHPAQYNSVWQ